MKTINNLSNCASYIQFMLMTPISYKIRRGFDIGYGYKTDTFTTNILGDPTAKDL